MINVQISHLGKACTQKNLMQNPHLSVSLYRLLYATHRLRATSTQERELAD